MQNPYTIKPSSVDDAELFASLIRAFWKDSVPPEASGHRITGAEIMLRLEQGGGFFLLDGEKYMDTVYYSNQGLPPKIWEVMGVGLDHAYRGRGLSSVLMQAVEQEALARGILELRLGVRVDHATDKKVAIYQREGYEIDDTLEYSHANPLTRPPVVMKKTLERVKRV
jgi:GNAT superfamily N-acetyltransferase